MDGPKRLAALLQGVSQQTFFKNAAYTDAFLQAELYANDAQSERRGAGAGGAFVRLTKTTDGTQSLPKTRRWRASCWACSPGRTWTRRRFAPRACAVFRYAAFNRLRCFARRSGF